MRIIEYEHIIYSNITPSLSFYHTLHFTKCFHKSFHWVFKLPPTRIRAWISRWENGKIRKKKWFSQGNSPIFILCFIYWGLSLLPSQNSDLKPRNHIWLWLLSHQSPHESMSFRTQPLPHHLCARCLNSVLPTWIGCSGAPGTWQAYWNQTQ